MKIEETILALFKQPEMRSVIRKLASTLPQPKIEWSGEVGDLLDPIVIISSSIRSEIQFEALKQTIQNATENRVGIIKSFEGDGSKIVAHLGTGVGLTVTCFGAYGIVKLDIEVYPEAFELVADQQELEAILGKLKKVREAIDEKIN